MRVFKHHFEHQCRVLGSERKCHPYILNVYHGKGRGRTVLQGLPATFGLRIRDELVGVGRAQFARPVRACDRITGRRDRAPGLIAVVARGGCKFVEKAKNVQRAGYKGKIL